MTTQSERANEKEMEEEAGRRRLYLVDPGGLPQVERSSLCDRAAVGVVHTIPMGDPEPVTCMTADRTWGRARTTPLFDPNFVTIPGNPNDPGDPRVHLLGEGA
jgi:hypothetical protein